MTANLDAGIKFAPTLKGTADTTLNTGYTNVNVKETKTAVSESTVTTM